MVAKFLCLFLASFVAVSSARVITQKGIADLEELSTGDSYIFETEILNALNKLKDFLKKGDPKNGIPPLDPFFLSQQNFDFIMEDTELEGFFKNVTFAKFSDFKPQNIEFKLLPLHLKIDILFEELLIYGRYKLAGKIFDEISVNGTGKFTSETSNLNVSLYIKPTKVDSSLQIKDLLFEFKTLGEKISYTNEYENNELKFLDEDFALSILDKIQEKYVPSLLNMGKLVLNDILLGYSFQEIVDLIIDFLTKK